MATVLLDPNEVFPLAAGADVFGRAGGTEGIIVLNGATGITTNAEIERLDLPENLSAYTFQVTGNGLEIRLASQSIVTIPSLNQPVDIRFADGNGTLTQTGGQLFTLAGGNGGIATIDTTASTPVVSLGPDTFGFDPGSGGGGQTFSVTADVRLEPDSVFVGLETAIRESVETALEGWTELMIVPKDLTVAIDVSAADTNALAYGGSSFFSGDVMPGGGVASVLADKLINGEDSNGNEADAFIGLSRQNLSLLSFEEQVASNKISATNVFMHEIGHALGILSFRDDPSAPFESVWGTFLEEDGGSLIFTGPSAMAANGGTPVPLDGDAHISEAIYGPALMTPIAEFGGGEVLTDIEIGILTDLGFSLVPDAATLI